jgi:hypothetical protein
MKEKEEVTTETIFLMILALALIVPGIILTGYVLTILWGWFVTPAFGLAVPSIPIMLGLSLIVGYMTHQTPAVEDNRTANKIFMTGIMNSLGRPLLYLGIGYIIHLYV